MGTIARPFTYTAGNTIEPSEVTSNETTIYDEFNGSISNVNISASAAIAASKLALQSGTTASLSEILRLSDGAKIQFGTTTQTIDVGSGGTATHSTGLISLFGGSRGYLVGLGFANSGASASHSIIVSPGQARDQTDLHTIILTATLTVNLDTAGLNGLATGTMATATSYHVHLIEMTSGTTGVLLDLGVSATAALDETDVGYARRIGSIMTEPATGTATIIPFSQNEDEFLLDNPALDVNDTAHAASAVSQPLSTPGGLQNEAKVNLLVTIAGGAVNLYVSPLDQDDEAPSITVAPLTSVRSNAAGEFGVGGPFVIRTNTSSQIRTRPSSASSTVRVSTLGWIDTRGRND